MSHTLIKYQIYICVQASKKADAKSWDVYPKRGDGVVALYGHMVEGKTYVCSLTSSPDKIQVSGFFKITEVTQEWKRRKLVDVHQKAASIGFMDLYFDVATCKKQLKFQETYTRKQRIRA